MPPAVDRRGSGEEKDAAAETPMMDSPLVDRSVAVSRTDGDSRPRWRGGFTEAAGRSE